jgi:signal transduction histidine kinase
MQNAAREVLDSSALMMRLVDDLLDTSRLSSRQLELKLDELDLAPWLARIARAFGHAMPTHTVVAELPESLPYVRVDLARLEQVINNLLSNAARYSPAGTSIRVTARALGGNMVEVRVADQGVGIPPGDRERVFEKFYRGKDGPILAMRGVGLGLSVARALVEAHGGMIGVESEVGRGSSFWVRLPAGTAVPGSEPGPAADALALHPFLHEPAPLEAREIPPGGGQHALVPALQP